MFVNSVKKQKRQYISLQKKIEILDCIKRGEKISEICKVFNLNHSTICGIQKKEDEIRNRISIESQLSINQTARIKNNLLAKTENCLITWIEDRRRNIPLNGYLIKKKAINLFQYLKEREPESAETFLASNGWFEHFKKRFSLTNIKIHGESSSADVEAAKEFSDQLKTIIKTEGYTADQVFNADETGLNWKRMPGRTYVSKTEKSASGFKALKDRITLLLCSNASGDLLTKPLVINRFLKPRAFKGVNSEDLPVYWMANKKAWVTQEIFKDWFYNFFVPDVRDYTHRKNIAFKILLIIDNAPGHPKELYHPNVKVIFAPPNTTSIIQPMDQGIIKAFKSYYMRYTFEMIIDELDANGDSTLLKILKKFSILNCIQVIGSCLKEMKPSTLNACWRLIWPEIVSKDNEPVSLIPVNERIISISRLLGGEGFDDMNINDIEEYINNDMDLNEEDLISLVDETASEESLQTSNYEPSENSNSVEIDEGLQLTNELIQHLTKCDPMNQRSAEIKKISEMCKVLYKEYEKELALANKENNPPSKEITQPMRKKAKWNRISSSDSDE